MHALLLMALSVAHAHQPSYGGDWSTSDGAFQVDDPAISIVVYKQITCDEPHLWLTFDATAGEDVWVQLGTPVIDRLEDYRPAMAVLGPDLPELDPATVPFDIPAGLGGVVYPSESPVEFYEPFTQTSSWILAEDWITMPTSGTSYLVAWDPGNQTGKLWLAMGVVEDFSDVDWSEAASWGEDVNNFHETGVYEPAPDVEEVVCDVDPGTEPGPTEGTTGTDGMNPAEGNPTDAATGGCNTAPGAPVGAAWALLLLGLFRRGRRS